MPPSLLKSARLKESLVMVADVEGLEATLVLNVIAKSAASVALDNGIGNVWGLEGTQSLMSMFPHAFIILFGHI